MDTMNLHVQLRSLEMDRRSHFPGEEGEVEDSLVARGCLSPSDWDLVSNTFQIPVTRSC